MKANHNGADQAAPPVGVVVNINKSKNESKSQLVLMQVIIFFVVVNINKSKNESKSQLCLVYIQDFMFCGKYQ